MPVQSAKILLTVVGVLVYLIGTRFGLPWLNWAGIVLVVLAWLLRFYRPAGPRQTVTSPQEEVP